MAGYTATEFNNRLEAQTSGQTSDEFSAIRTAAKTFAAAVITQCDTKANGNDRFQVGMVGPFLDRLVHELTVLGSNFE